MPDVTPPNPPQGKRFQFSLRAIFLVTTSVAFTMAYLSFWRLLGLALLLLGVIAGTMSVQMLVWVARTAAKPTFSSLGITVVLLLAGVSAVLILAALYFFATPWVPL